MTADDRRRRDGSGPGDPRTAGPIPDESLAREHERRDFGGRWLAAGLALLAAIVVVAVLAMDLLFGVLQGREAARGAAPLPMIETGALPPEPRLEVEPGRLLQRQRAIDEALLNSYGWLDRELGIVRIPVARAMEVLAERGLPVRRQPAAPEGDMGTGDSR